MTPDYCPNCGEAVPQNAKACPECGADEKTGWSDSAQSDRLGIPDDSFDYNEFVQEEFGGKKAKPRGIPTWARIAIAVALVLILLGLLR